MTGGNVFQEQAMARVLHSLATPPTIGTYRQSRTARWHFDEQSLTWNLTGGLIVGDNRAPFASPCATNDIGFQYRLGKSLLRQYITANGRPPKPWDSDGVTFNQTGGDGQYDWGHGGEQCRLPNLGHWPSSNVTYNMSGGTLIM